MATTHVYRNAYLSVGGSDLSTYVQECALTVSYEELDATVMGATAKNAYPGLQDWSIDVTCKHSWTDNELDEIISAIVGAAAASAIILKPNGATTGVSNPKWTANGRIFEYSPMSGSVGSLAQTSFTIKPGDGTAIARAVAD